MISILTPTILGREDMLEECVASVNAQTFTEFEHLVETDAERHGCSRTMNSLARKACGNYLLPLADDDLLLPGGLEALIYRRDDGDIIYAPPAMWGWQSWHFFQDPPLIPSFALIPTKLWFELGGYDEDATREEDRKLWTRALEAGATFAKVDYPCWVYRIHGGNKSMNGGQSS